MNLATDNNQTLVLAGADDSFHVVNAPNPGSGSNILAGAATIDGTSWAVGHFDDGGSRLPLIEKHSVESAR